MQHGLGITLGILGLFLVVSMAGIVAAAVRDARLEPGAIPSPNRRRRAILATAGSLVVMALLIWGGATWWNVEAASYALDVYHPMAVTPTLSGNLLDFKVQPYDDGKERSSRSNKDFLPDHGHLMHLYAIREPEMDAVFHLHPEPTGKQGLSMVLPAMPAGTYKLYGDVVFLNGFPETETATLTVPAGVSTAALGIEDASAAPPPISAGDLGPAYKLPDGYTMVWDKPATITAGTPYAFRFTLLDAGGKPANDMQPYLGMAGHAAFVKTDGTTFAHTHPEGSAAMPAMMLADESTMAMGGMNDMSGMAGGSEPVKPVVEFPYGFPSAGRYRIFIQMKHGSTVETGVFDAEVK